MKQAVWGYAVLVLGVLAIMITWFFTQVTNTDQHNYNLLKETVESAMYDAIDLSAYRNDGSIEINEVKFMESFVRRFAENADLSNTYDIYIYDISTKPPKVSLSVNSCKQTNGTNCNKSADNLTFTISNRVDAILETEWTKQEPQDVKITFKIPGSEDKTSIVKEGETIILPSMPTWCNDETVTFKDSAGHIYTNSDIAIKDVTLEFQCSNVKSYSISYNLDGGTNYSGAPTSYTYGVGATINGTPTKTGYTFGGWCTDSAKSNCSTSQTISKTTTESKTLYAKWSLKTITCNAGQYLPKNSITCTACTAGSYCTGGSYNYSSSNQGIEGCPSGYTSDVSAKKQSSCYISVSAGKYIATVNSSTQTACEAGTYKGKHTVNYGSTSSCSSCEAGTYNTTTGNSSCTTCPAGSYCTGGSNKTSCGSGKTSAAGAKSSSDCYSTYTYYKWDENGRYCWNFAEKHLGGGQNFDKGKLWLCPNANNNGCVVASNTACGNINNKYSYFRLEG